MSQQTNAGFSPVMILIGVVIVALIGTVGVLVYRDHHKTATTTAASTKSQTPKTSSVTIPKTTTPLVSTTTIFKIPELGVEITVPNTIKDIVYKVNPPSTVSTGQQTQSVMLSTQTLTSLDPGCGINGAVPALGFVYKTQGQYPANPDVGAGNATGGLVKQFPTYYIGWGNPQAVCSDSNTIQTEATADTNLFSTALHATVQPIQ